SNRAIEPAERTFPDRLTGALTQPPQYCSHRDARHSCDEPAKQPKHDSGSGTFPVLSDPLRGQCNRPQAQEQAEQDGHLGHGAAKQAAEGKPKDQDDEDPVHPGEPGEESQVRLDLRLTTGHVLPLGRVQLALAPLTGLLEVLMSAQIGKDAGLLTLLLETTQGTLEGLAV